MESNTSRTVLNLTDNSVTREQYVTALTSLGDFLCELRHAKGWCGESHQYFTAIYPEYDRHERNAHQHAPLMDLVPDDADYGDRLRRIRARVLWYVNADLTDLITANDAFIMMGIPTYPDKSVSIESQIYVYLPTLYLSVSAPSMNEAIDWAESDLLDAVAAAVNGHPIPAGSPIVPGSVRFAESPGIDVYRVGLGNEQIMSADTERPSYS